MLGRLRRHLERVSAENEESKRLMKIAWEKKYVTDLSRPGSIKGWDTYSEFVQCNNCRFEYNIRVNKGIPLPNAARCPACLVTASWTRATDYSGWI